MAAGVKIPEGFVDELKARIRPSDVIGRKVKLRKQGKEWVGLSPFTNEKTPSFYVNDQKRIFKCFSSGMGGDVISFVMETERLSFMEAVEKLAEEAGMSLPKATPEDTEAYDRRQRLFAACEAATKYFETQLRDQAGAEARDYLAGRGLLPESWSRYRLGFAPDSWRATSDHLKSLGFTETELTDAGLLVQKEGGGEPYDRFRGRIIFPIDDRRGAVIAFGGRAISPDAKPKYLNSSDTELFHKSRILYRYKAARDAFGGTDEGGLIVCEGYMDVIALAEAGFSHAVAPLGTALTEDQLNLLWRAGPEPILCFDGDRAGLGAANRAIDRALPNLQPGKSVFFCLLSDGLDPDDLVRTRGPAALRDQLENSLPLVELLWRRERDAEPADTPERQAGLERRLMAAAATIQDQAVRNAYERDLRTRLRDFVWEQRRQARAPGKSGGKPWEKKASDPLNQRPRLARTTGLGQVVRAVDYHHLAENHIETLALAQFPDPDVSEIRDAIITQIQSGLTVDRATLATHLTQCGKLRAAELLNSYPKIPDIVPGSTSEREWLIALEQYARMDGTALPAGAAEDAFRDAADARLRHRRVSERRAKTVRLNEATEIADKD